MKKLFYASGIILMLALTSLVVACRDSNAGGADLSHMFNTLRVDTASPANAKFAAAIYPFRKHRSSAWVGFIQDAEASVGLITSTGCPTIVGRHPHYYDIITCSGIHAQVSEAPTASDLSVLLPPQDGQWQVFYEGAGCQGQAWTRSSNGIGGTDLVQGDAIFVDVNFTGPDDAGNYLWVNPVNPISGDVSIQSFFDGGSCQASSTVQTGLYKLTPIPADGTGVGWPAAPVTGPIFMGPAS